MMTRLVGEKMENKKEIKEVRVVEIKELVAGTNWLRNISFLRWSDFFDEDEAD